MKRLDHSFEINSYLLCKMGWSKYPENFTKLDAQYVVKQLSEDKLGVLRNIKWTFKSNKKILFIIRELTDKQKLFEKKLYKITVLDKKTVKDKLFSSNQELIRLIIDNECASEEYIRHFKLIKILK